MSEGPAPSKVAALRRFAAENRLAALVGSNVAISVVRVASNLLLTRMLAPEAFGAVGVISAVIYFFVMLVDLGVGPFVVRSREGEDRRFLNVVWTARLLRNALMAAVMFGLAGAIAEAFNKPELQAGIAAASLILVIDGLRSMSYISADRQRRVSYISAVELAAFLIQTAAGIAAAAVLGNYWAIVFAMYVNAIANVIFSYALFPHSGQRFALDARILRDLWGFSRIIMLSSLITLVLSQADRLIVGRNLPLDAFGLYMLAVSLVMAARQLIYSWAVRMLYPHFAEAARRAPGAVAEVYYLTRRKLSLLLALALGGAVGGGTLVARILFDPRYLDSGVYISLLAVAPLMSLAAVPADMAMTAMGRIRMTLEGNFVRLVWIALAAPAGYALGGLFGVIVAFAFVELPALVYWLWRLAGARILDWKEEGLLLATALLGAAVGFVAERGADSAVGAGLLPAF